MVRLLPEPWVCQTTPPRSSSFAPASSRVEPGPAGPQLVDHLLHGPVLLVAADRLDRLRGLAVLDLERELEDVVPDDVEQVLRLEHDADQLVLLGQLGPRLQQPPTVRRTPLLQLTPQLPRVAVVGRDAAPRRVVRLVGGDRAERGGLAAGGDQQLGGREQLGDGPGPVPALPAVVGQRVPGVRPQVADRRADGVLDVGTLALDDGDGDAVDEEDEVEDLRFPVRCVDPELVDDQEFVALEVFWVLEVPVDVMDLLFGAVVVDLVALHQRAVQQQFGGVVVGGEQRAPGDVPGRLPQVLLGPA
jgi:hypothetical protein